MNNPSRGLRVLLVAAEAAPFVENSPVAETVSGLARALKAIGVDARIAIPRHAHITHEQYALQPVLPSFAVPMDSHHEPASVWSALLQDTVPIYLVDNPGYFSVDDAYLQTIQAERYVFFSRAVLEMLRQSALEWRPDVVHCHDWHTGIIPNWLKTLYDDDPIYADLASVFTIHSLTDQGISGYRVLELAGLASYGYLEHPDIGELSELVDPLARGIHHADAVTTTSQRYAYEVLTPEFGQRLDPLLRDRKQSLFGVLSGIDTQVYDPSQDAEIASQYDATSLERRLPNKAALQRSLGLEARRGAPLIGMVSRLCSDKGLDLVTGAMEVALKNLDVEFVLMGTGDRKHEELLSDYAQRHPGRVALHIGFDRGLERRIYAGCDMLLMPSLCEPSATTALRAIRYSCVPIVRATGGLADALSNYDPARRDEDSKPAGFVFESFDTLALYTAIVRATEVYRHPQLWRSLQLRCALADFSWAGVVSKYLEVYSFAQQQRRGYRSELAATA